MQKHTGFFIKFDRIEPCSNRVEPRLRRVRSRLSLVKPRFSRVEPITSYRPYRRRP